VKQAKPRKRKRFGSIAFRLVLVALMITVYGVVIYRGADDSLAADLSKRTVNDITMLNPIQVGRVVAPTSVEEIAQLLRTTQGPVSIGGARCSMGGQTALAGSLHLDMRQMNELVSLSKDERLATVQAGMRWRDLQDLIDPHDLAVKIMQTYATFTVGGTLSVNAHGRYMGLGPVVQSVRAIKVVLASGEVVNASREQNAEIFWGVIGGYGGLGVIAEATLELVPNHKVKRMTETMAASEYGAFFRDHIRSDPNVIFHNADLHPPSFDTLRAVSWLKTDAALTDEQRLIPRDDVYRWTPLLINKVGLFPLGDAIRKHVLEPIFYASDAVTWRNHEASYDVRELEPSDRSSSTYVLREYFVPVAQLDAFLPKMREVFQKHDVNVINISIRYATSDPGTVLAWARGETFAFVVYYEQETTPEAIAEVRAWSRELVEAAISVGGTYYLPYQVHSTREQFMRAYPRAADFFALKAKLDPQLRFQNTLWNAYGPMPHQELHQKLARQAHYEKPEGQTLLTIPEWYLVFNPLEYARHLRAGRPGDTFPFVASLTEYWSLYKRVLRASDGVYPENGEYLTMLRVIGVSTTAEYLIKGAYEATFGRLARWTSDGAKSLEDETIADAHAAYSDLIFHEPWYAFEFLPWVWKVWHDTSLFGPNLIRRTERKLAFSLEFIVKAGYAKLIELAAGSAYDAPQETVLAAVQAGALADLQVDPRVKVRQSASDGTHVISIPRWGPFTEIVPKLAQRGVRFLEIAGNDDIAISVIRPGAHAASSTGLPRAHGQRLFDSKLVSDASRIRSVLLVPVAQLSQLLRELPATSVQLEHIYDY
jgi:FAD/FMN-containing dehydrogenase